MNKEYTFTLLFMKLYSMSFLMLEIVSISLVGRGILAYLVLSHKIKYKNLSGFTCRY